MAVAAALSRCLFAFVTGWIAYMILAVVNVLLPPTGIETYVGFVIQMVMGAVITLVCVVALLMVGLPFYWIRARWFAWTAVFICLAMIVGGPCSLILAHVPGLTAQAPHPEFPGETVWVGNPTLMVTGWLSLIFGITHFGGPGWPARPRDRRVERCY